jgi:hypothetical protein
MPSDIEDLRHAVCDKKRDTATWENRVGSSALMAVSFL